MACDGAIQYMILAQDVQELSLGWAPDLPIQCSRRVGGVNFALGEQLLVVGYGG
jgi:hypothetical protein